MDADSLAAAVESLASEYNLEAEVAGRIIRFPEPVRDARLSALRAVAEAQRVAPVGAAASAAEAVGAAVWSPPDVYLARWTATGRWIVGYRLPGGSRPNDFVRTDARIPGYLETGNWYRSVPDEVRAAFEAVGLSVDDPPFPPPAPPPAPARAAPARRTPRAAPARASSPRREPGSAPARPTAGTEPAPTAPRDRQCPGCFMRRPLSQFGPASDLCADCRAG